MQTFSAPLGSNATGAASPRTSPSGGAPDDHRDPGGFDRLMQSQPHGDARTSSPKQETSRTQDGERSREPERSRKADEGAKREAKGAESRADDGPRRTEAKDSDGAARDAQGQDESAGSEAGDTPATPAAPADASVTAEASSPASLPEQLLAMLNGLAAAPAATPAAAPVDTAPALPSDALASNSTGTTRPLPPLQPTAVSGDAPPAANDADANAFALAMAATATTGDAAPETTLDTTTTGEITTAPLSVSNATVHPLTRAAAAAVQANQPLSVDAGFEDNFGSRIAWLADQKVGHAEIRVSPDHLGTIDVRLQLDGNRVNAEFHSTQAEVRHALESSLPRLRDMLGQQGLQLGHADVGQRQPGGQPSGSPTPSSSGERGDAHADAGWTPGPAVRSTRGLLDEYA